MSNRDAFFEHIEQGYSCKGDYIIMGAAMHEGETVTGAHVKVPLKTLNRHGLIAGATGTGKTKSLQVIAENLSEKRNTGLAHGSERRLERNCTT